jgi:hypothetical protein
VDDDGGLLDHRQAVLDPVGEDDAGGRQERAQAHRRVVARRERDERQRLASSVSKRAEQLMATGSPSGIDGRSDQDE